MNKIGKKILFLVAGLLFLSSNLDAAARAAGRTTKKKTPTAHIDNKRVERKADDKKAECSICLQPMDPLDNDTEGGVQATACMHIFHKNCLDQALRANPICPICRRNLNPQTYGLREAAQPAPGRRAAPAPIRGNHFVAQNIQNLPGPVRWCLYFVECCFRCPRAPRNLARR